MATVRGGAVIYGTDTFTLTGGIVSGTSAAHVQSGGLSRDSGKVEVVNASGDVVIQVFHSKRKTLTLQVVPYHATGLANAKTAFGAWCAAAGGTVSVAGTAGGFADDVYNIVSSNGSLSTNAAGLVDLVLEAFDDNDVTTATT